MRLTTGFMLKFSEKLIEQMLFHKMIPVCILDEKFNHPVNLQISLQLR